MPVSDTVSAAPFLPAGDTPANTEEYEGFFHLCEMSGDVSSASLDYIIRDHDRTRFEERKKEMERLVAKINEEYVQYFR